MITMSGKEGYPLTVMLKNEMFKPFYLKLVICHLIFQNEEDILFISFSSLANSNSVHWPMDVQVKQDQSKDDDR